VLLVLICLRAAVGTASHYGYIKVEMKVERCENAALDRRLHNPPSETDAKIAIREEMTQNLWQAWSYIAEDHEQTLDAFKRVLRLIDQHPDYLGPTSTIALSLRESYVARLAKDPSNPECLRETNARAKACSQRPEEYDQRGILNIPLQRDLPVLMERQGRAKQRVQSASGITEYEEWKIVFQMPFREYNPLIQFYVGDDALIRNDTMANETIEHLLSALEAELGPSFERAPMRRRARSTEIDKEFIYSYLDELCQRFRDSTDQHTRLNLS
jgi:hypothetical protein